jgi:hydrogenase 3 maturation protease
MNGDDAAGVLAARLLQKRLVKVFQAQGKDYQFKGATFTTDGLLIIDAGLAPESYSGVLRRFMPGIVLLLDVAEMGKPAGDLEVLRWQDAGGFSASTHMQPLATLAQYLIDETQCQVAVVGIQPEHLDFDRRVSERVRSGVRRLADRIMRLIL